MNAEQAHKLPHLRFDGIPFGMLSGAGFTAPIVPLMRKQHVDNMAPFPFSLFSFWDADDRALSRGGEGRSAGSCTYVACNRRKKASVAPDTMYDPYRDLIFLSFRKTPGHEMPVEERFFAGKGVKRSLFAIENENCQHIDTAIPHF